MTQSTRSTQSSNPQQKKKGCKRKRKQDLEYEYEFYMDEEYEGDETLSDETKNRNCILAEYDIVPAGIEITKMDTNPLVLVFLNALMTECAGCELNFTHADRKKPNDMVFKYIMVHQREDGTGDMVENTYKTLACFHSKDLGCVRCIEELCFTELADIYMLNETTRTLQKEHINELKKCKMWDDLVCTRQQLIYMN